MDLLKNDKNEWYGFEQSDLGSLPHDLSGLRVQAGSKGRWLLADSAQSMPQGLWVMLVKPVEWAMVS